MLAQNPDIVDGIKLISKGNHRRQRNNTVMIKCDVSVRLRISRIRRFFTAQTNSTRSCLHGNFINTATRTKKSVHLLQII